MDGYSLDLESADFWGAFNEVSQKSQKDKIPYNFVVRPGSNLAIPVSPEEEAEYFAEGEYDARMAEIAKTEEMELPTIETKEQLEALLRWLFHGQRTA